MRVAFYGVRGSIPSPGAHTVRYGGNSVCVHVTLADGSHLFLDAGTGLRGLGQHLGPTFEGDLHFLLSHAHWDHLLGLPFFGPIYRPGVRVHMHPDAAATPSWVWDGVHFPVPLNKLQAELCNVTPEDAGRVGSARISRIALNHPGGSTGFRIDDADGASLAYLTDNELSPPDGLITTPDALARFARGVDLLVHDAQYLSEELVDHAGYGHSSIPQVLSLIAQADPVMGALFHHAPWRTDDELDVIAEQAEEWMRKRTARCRVWMARERAALQVSPGSVVQLPDVPAWR